MTVRKNHLPVCLCACVLWPFLSCTAGSKYTCAWVGGCAFGRKRESNKETERKKRRKRERYFTYTWLSGWVHLGVLVDRGEWWGMKSLEAQRGSEWGRAEAAVRENNSAWQGWHQRTPACCTAAVQGRPEVSDTGLIDQWTTCKQPSVLWQEWSRGGANTPATLKRLWASALLDSSQHTIFPRVSPLPINSGPLTLKPRAGNISRAS